MRPQPLLLCRDVLASSRFYEALLGCGGGLGGTEYERLWDPKLHERRWGSDGFVQEGT